LPGDLCTRKFYRNCYAALAPGGVAVFNLVPTAPFYSERCNRIANAFDGCRAYKDVEGLNNVLIASRGTLSAQRFRVPPEWSSSAQLTTTLQRMYTG
jgi:spermidine synthase